MLKPPPQSREEFLVWYDKQTDWNENHTYKDISVSSDRLQRFYGDIVQVFPSMNVDDETFEAMEEEGTDNRLTEYSTRRDMVYIAFAWSVAEEAYETVRALAVKHQIGFFDVSGSEGDIIRLY